jgi:hypothetical protein
MSFQFPSYSSGVFFFLFDCPFALFFVFFNSKTNNERCQILWMLSVSLRLLTAFAVTNKVITLRDTCIHISLQAEVIQQQQQQKYIYSYENLNRNGSIAVSTGQHTPNTIHIVGITQLPCRRSKYMAPGSILPCC